MTCTWKNCNRDGIHELKDRNGKVWAILCDHHYDIHETAVNDAVKKGGEVNIKWMLSAWVLAHGGAKKMAETM